MDELDETMGNVEVAMDGLGEEFELLKSDLRWGIVLFVVPSRSSCSTSGDSQESIAKPRPPTSNPRGWTSIKGLQ